mmetsp:Transcript_157928/g.294598  ORF Transcript_157928/g.294598 Transcript_157928/m.294598 type:complete len:363 (+) Transcript_157928:87-1175(+)
MTLDSWTQHQGKHQTTGSTKGKRPFQPYHSINVPRKSDLESGFLKRNNVVTTIMLRNIPNRYTQSHLIEEIDGMGFAGRFDFFYLPMDVHNRTNVGYAFINFLTPADAQTFFFTFRDYMFKRHSSKKIAGVSPAHVQGLVGNLQNFLNKAVTQSRDSQYRPVVFVNGIRRDITEALEELQQRPESVPQRPPTYTPAAADASAVASGARSALPRANASRRDVGSVPWPAAGPPEPPHYGSRQAKRTEVPTPNVQKHVAEDAIPTATVPAGEDATQQAFVDARRAFENAVSTWLQDSQSSRAIASFGSTTQCDSDAGSRTGTPRSACSSLAGWKGSHTGEIDCENLTPRTDQRLLGMSFPTFSL